MPSFDGFLMRDTLDDNGTVPSPGYPYYSPDQICHSQVADAKKFFTDNYDKDPNQPVELGSAVNYYYVRAKNLSSKTLAGYKIAIFRASASLFMRPSIWRNNPLKTQAGELFVALDSTDSGAISVGDKPFLLDGISSDNFCLIGMAYDTADPPIPNDFDSYEAYILWVRRNQNVCGRNLRMVRDFPKRDFEMLDGFSNPEAYAVPTLFQVTVHGTLPTGSTFGLTCAPLDLKTEWKIDDGKVKTASAMTPGNFDGNVTSWATLSSGSWPDGAWIETIVYVGVAATSEAARYAETKWSHLNGVAPEIIDAARPHLVPIGNCASIFYTAA